jgi:hypothetical protein
MADPNSKVDGFESQCLINLTAPVAFIEQCKVQLFLIWIQAITRRVTG